MKSSHIFLFSLLLLSFQASAMEGEDNKKITMRVKQPGSEQEKDIKKGESTPHIPEEGQVKKECCYHWGLHRWSIGIGEYIQRFFLCGYEFDYTRTDRAWVTDYKEGSPLYTSDCLISPSPVTLCNRNNCCESPLYGIVCAPYMAANLLCALPYALYHNTPHQRPGVDPCLEVLAVGGFCFPFACCYVNCGCNPDEIVYQPEHKNLPEGKRSCCLGCFLTGTS